MSVCDAQRVDEVVQLPDEELGSPELRAAVRVVRAAPVPDLVVMDDRAGAAEIGEREEVVVCRAGAAVENDERRRPVGSEVARDAVPRLGAVSGERERDGSFAHLHRRDSTSWV